MHLVDGLIRSKPDIQLIQFTMGLCGPVIGVAPFDAEASKGVVGCRDFNDKVVEWVKNNETVKYAVLSSHFGQYVRSNWQLYLGDGAEPAGSEIATEKIVATLGFLRKRGIIPVVVSPPPSFGGDIGRCLLRSRFLGVDETRCDFREEDRRAEDYKSLNY